MRASSLLKLLALLPLAQCTRSAKRGLVYVPSQKYPGDDQIWSSSGSDLDWYYNYSPNPSASFKNTGLEFVPMLFTAPTDASDTSFLDTVNAQLDSGANITAVLSFNEPDGSSSTGGSAIPADLAAATWIREIEPLKKRGVKLGGPAVTGAPTGFNWLQNFFIACDGRCSVDFLPVHWYGNFEGLASHIGQVYGTYQNMTIWVTEYADAHVSLQEAQVFYNQSSEYFDRIDYIERYSYFGAFRSDVSNVGPNAAMLTQDGKLTDIGSWYLGGIATGNIPQSSDARRSFAFAGSSLFCVLVAFWCWA